MTITFTKEKSVSESSSRVLKSQTTWHFETKWMRDEYFRKIVKEYSQKQTKKEETRKIDF